MTELISIPKILKRECMATYISAENNKKLSELSEETGIGMIRLSDFVFSLGLKSIITKEVCCDD